MKVLLVNGSPNAQGSTYTALKEAAGVLQKAGMEVEWFHIGSQPVRGCIGCAKCRESGLCIFKDDKANALLERMQQADGILVGSPVYYAGPNGALCALLDRVFFAGAATLSGKPAGVLVCCRRGGATAALDRLSKYFSINRMPLVSSQYWNMVHGLNEEDVVQDLEGMQVMRTLGQEMAYLLECLQNRPRPQPEKRVSTNFIR